jgi:hypothetical protein
LHADFTFFAVALHLGDVFALSFQVRPRLGGIGDRRAGAACQAGYTGKPNQT